MSIEHAVGSIFDSDAEALVNPVNTDGVGGKGLALAFRNKYPKCYASYVQMCSHKLLAPGNVFLCYASNLVNGPGSVIVYFPTKEHWRNPSKLEYVTTGLTALTRALRVHNITSVAIPALGCGLGGLDWQTVRAAIVQHFEATAPLVRVTLYSPLSHA